MNQPLIVGTVADVCHYLGDISRTTLWRRMKDRPECFRRLGKRTIALISL